jgi:hypothetical protein
VGEVKNTTSKQFHEGMPVQNKAIMKRSVVAYHKEERIPITIIWILPPELVRYRQPISGEDVQVETPVSESDDDQSKPEHTTALRHESTGDLGTRSEGTI